MNLLQKFTFRRLSNPRSVAKNVLRLVEAEQQYNQRIWMSVSYFEGKNYWDREATGTELRRIANQNVCGTEACVAGNTVILTMAANEKYVYSINAVVTPNGGQTDIKEYAAAKLGLTPLEAHWLFAEWRSREDVIESLKRLSKGKSISDLVN